MNKKAKAAAPDNKSQLRLSKAEWGHKSEERTGAEIAQSPIYCHAQTSRLFTRGMYGDTDLTEAVAVIREKAAKVQAGDLSEAEAMLTAQATALDAIFTEMARRAAINMGEYLTAAERYMRLALKAQSQCRTTLEALAEIKNPRPVAFVKQANIAHGPQQVNNGTVPADGLPAHGKIPNPSNELSGGSLELLPDTRASQAASRIDTPVETVGAIDRAEDRGRESHQRGQFQKARDALA